MGDILSEKYLAVIKQTSKGPQWDKGDPAVGKVLQLNVKAYTGQDLAMNPAAYEPAKPGKAEGLVMIPLKLHRDNAADKAVLAKARHRTFTFGRSDGTDEAPWTVKTDGGFGFHMDPRRLNASTQLSSGPTDAGVTGFGTLEVWNIKAGGKGWSHPVHVHFEEGIILSRGGKAPQSGKSGRAKTSIVLARKRMAWTASRWRSTSASSLEPTWSTATTLSMRTTRCCCAGTWRNPVSCN